MEIHKGHRQRVKERFRKEGLDGFNEINALELLLFYCIPRIDTNELAHALLEHFGSFGLVLDAPVEELEKVKGMGKNAATFLSLVSSVSRYYQVNKSQNTGVVDTIEDCARLLVPKFQGKRDEMVYILCLDSKCKPFCTKLVGEGTVNSTNISIRKIAEIALSVNASSVIIAHNHPSGLPVPSVEDIQTTQHLVKVLRTLDLVVVDHLIVADNKYTAVIASGFLNGSNLD